MSSSAFQSIEMPDDNSSEQLRTVSIGTTIKGSSLILPEVSLPSLEALKSSQLAKLVAQMRISEGYGAGEAISSLLDAYNERTSLGGFDSVHWVAERARRIDQDVYDRKQAEEILQLSVLHNRAAVEDVIIQYLREGTSRQQRLLLGVLSGASYFNERVCNVCIELLGNSSLQEHISLLLSINSPHTTPLAEAAVEVVIEEYGEDVLRIGYYAESLASQLMDWCIANGDFSLITTKLDCGDMKSEAFALDMLARNEELIKQHEDTVVNGLRSQARFVAREALKGLNTIPEVARRYLEAIKTVVFAQYDLTSAYGLVLLSKIAPEDTDFIQCLRDQTEAISYYSGECNSSDSSTPDQEELLLNVAQISEAAARLFCTNSHRIGYEIIDGLISSPFEEFRSYGGKALKFVDDFNQIKPLLEQILTDVPANISNAFLIASRFRSQAVPWFEEVQRKFEAEQIEGKRSRSELEEALRLVRHWRLIASNNEY